MLIKGEGQWPVNDTDQYILIWSDIMVGWQNNYLPI